jgi:hypothetical protein
VGGSGAQYLPRMDDRRRGRPGRRADEGTAAVADEGEAVGGRGCNLGSCGTWKGGVNGGTAYGNAGSISADCAAAWRGPAEFADIYAHVHISS